MTRIRVTRAQRRDLGRCGGIENLTTGVTLVNTTVPGGNAIGAGQSQPLSYTVRIPDGNVSVGQIQFTVTTDANNSVFEYNSAGTGEANNSTSLDGAVSLSAYPDLQVTNVGISPSTGVLFRLDRAGIVG